MALPKKPMTENEKKAKLIALKGAHKAASDVMSQSLTDRKDPKSLKDHVKEMSDDAMHNFKDDSDKIVDPEHLGKVMGRQVSFENADSAADDSSVYDPNDINSVDERIKKLMSMKKRV